MTCRDEDCLPPGVVVRHSHWLTYATGIVVYALVALCIFILLSQDVKAQSPDGEMTLSDWWGTSVWDNPNRSFQWYPPPPTALPPKEPDPAKMKAPDKKKPTKPVFNPKAALKDFKTTKEVQAHLEVLKDRAVMSPSPENVTAYYAFQMQVLDQGSTFADVARRVVWTTPELDYSTRRPTVNAAAQAFSTRELATIRKSNSKIAATHGMIFVFRSDCPYCHQMGPLLKEFSDKTGMEILAVSLDGGALPDWPGAKPNNGIAEKLQVSTVPAMYLFGKAKNEIQPIAFGVTSLNGLMERIHVLTQTTPGQEF